MENTALSGRKKGRKKVGGNEVFLTFSDLFLSAGVFHAFNLLKPRKTDFLSGDVRTRGALRHPPLWSLVIGQELTDDQKTTRVRYPKVATRKFPCFGLFSFSGRVLSLACVSNAKRSRFFAVRTHFLLLLCRCRSFPPKSILAFFRLSLLTS